MINTQNFRTLPEDTCYEYKRALVCLDLNFHTSQSENKMHEDETKMPGGLD